MAQVQSARVTALSISERGTTLWFHQLTKNGKGSFLYPSYQQYHDARKQRADEIRALKVAPGYERFQVTPRTTPLRPL
jgi:hypothetical protein